ncbi:MAG TPA: branched-chain amino acid aminotransferase [Alphaproteobacteria bacterium]|nr:branched-chain amino acid aminotransferase [Alphaproteobacteria bacterium]
MLPSLKITKVAQSRLPGLDIDTLVFGETFSDHMFTMVYEDGAWQNPEVVPYGPVPVPPGAISLHYAQAVFEGMKAYRGDDGAIRLFRPKRNADRLIASSERLCIPPIDEETFIGALHALIEVDADWIAPPPYSLYVRPVVFSIEDHIEVRPSRRYRFCIITTPVKAYFRDDGKGLSLKVEEDYTRAAPIGGLGAAKTGANYAGTLMSAAAARAEGFDQVLWLDGHERRFVEEAGLMNVFFKIDGRVITPPLGGTILPGITRESLIVLLGERGQSVEERAVDIDEVVEAAKAGQLEEIFACGTAAVVAPIGRLNHRGRDITPAGPIPGPVTQSLYDELSGIQYGRVPDRHGWTDVVVPSEDRITRRLA